MIKEESFGQVQEKTRPEEFPEIDRFGLSEKLEGVSNLPAAEALIKRLESVNQELADVARVEFQNLSFNDQELVEIFDNKFAELRPEEKINLRDRKMATVEEKRKEQISVNEKIEQMRFRLGAFADNFYAEFNGHFNNDQAFLKVAAAQGSRLPEYIREHAANQEALKQFEYFKSLVVEPLEKKLSAEERREVLLSLISTAIDLDKTSAKRALLLADNLGLVSRADLQAVLDDYFENFIKKEAAGAAPDRLKLDYRRRVFIKLYYNLLKFSFKE